MMEQTRLNIGTIGQRLEAARQAKGVTVSEAGRATKILAKFIEAMEADDFGVLSAPVYAKSFIKMYAQYLGLDARQLVEEYDAQHAPKGKNHLSDEVRQNLAKTDGTAAEPVIKPTPKPVGKVAGHIFGDVNKAIAKISVASLSPKLVAAVAGGILLIGIVVLSATQCSEDKEGSPAPAGGAASVSQGVIAEGVPDAYLARPGEVAVEKRGTP